MARIEDDPAFIALLDRYVARNERWTVKEFGMNSSLSPKAQKIWEFISRHSFEGKRKEIAKLASLLLEEEIVIVDETSLNFEKGVVVVPLGNPNGHNYVLGEPVICASAPQNSFLRADGNTGNHLTTSSSFVRPANRQEIKRALMIQRQHFSVEQLERYIA